MNTSFFEKVIFFVLACLVSFLVHVNQNIAAIHDDLLVLRTETKYTVKQLTARDQMLSDFSDLLKIHGERIFKLEFKLKNKI